MQGRAAALLSLVVFAAPVLGRAGEDEDFRQNGHHERRLSAETIAARQKFLGSMNVDSKTGAVRSDLVILSCLQQNRPKISRGCDLRRAIFGTLPRRPRTSF